MSNMPLSPPQQPDKIVIKKRCRGEAVADVAQNDQNNKFEEWAILVQLSLMESSHELVEFPNYYRQQLVTYIGNKRQLLHPISEALKTVQAATKRENCICLMALLAQE
ncbi:MAG: hypothetical protein F4138_03975 [Acidimicrobiia bacterium]|nr:hypothetical protein [Acidimicrobiia bacterium]